MRALRGLLAAAGVACGLWGLWLARDFSGEQLRSAAVWLAGGVVLHDLVLAPLVVLIGVAAARAIPRHARRAAAAAFVVWGTLTIAVLPLLSGQGGKPGNDTILGRPYALAWLVMTLLLTGFVVVSAARRRRRAGSAPAS
jgi:hypothetical protein